MSGSQQQYQSTYANDVVAVFDNAFNRLFQDARPMKATVREPAKLMKHPVESGFTTTDHRVIMSIQIDLNMTLTPATYVDTYNQIKSVFLGVSTVQVQTITGLYSNFFIGDMPHEENPDHFDTITIVLKLEQVIIVSPSSTTSLSSQNGGNKNGKTASATEAANANGKAKESSAAYSLLYGKGKE